jgi:hypothetical protein
MEATKGARTARKGKKRAGTGKRTHRKRERETSRPKRGSKTQNQQL